MNRRVARTLAGFWGTAALGRATFAMSVSVLFGCGGDGAPSGATAPAAPVLTVVHVALSQDTLGVGQAALAIITGLDQNGAAIGVPPPLWSTTSAAIATVSAAGVVTAVAPGHTTLVGSVNGKQGQVPLTVIPVPVSRVLISPEVARVVRGGNVQLTATALDFSAQVLSGRVVSWSSSDVTRATVSATGVVTAVTPGDVTIAATSEGVETTASVTVTALPDVVASVTVGPSAPSLTVGASIQLSATLTDVAGNTLAGRAVTWSVSGTAGLNVATVSGTGLVQALSPGTVIVEAFCEGQHGAVTIIVSDDVDAKIVVTFAAPVANGLVGDTLRVVVGVNTLYPVASVVAVVGPLRRPLALTYARIGALGNAYVWVGNIDVTDFPTGPYQVLATATDSRGGRGVGSVQFLRDTRVGKGGSSDAPKVK
ncbi:MAG: Ig-like domain-containing protein [bacterium]